MCVACLVFVRSHILLCLVDSSCGANFSISCCVCKYVLLFKFSSFVCLGMSVLDCENRAAFSASLLFRLELLLDGSIMLHKSIAVWDLRIFLYNSYCFGDAFCGADACSLCTRIHICKWDPKETSALLFLLLLW